MNHLAIHQWQLFVNEKGKIIPFCRTRIHTLGPGVTGSPIHQEKLCYTFLVQITDFRTAWDKACKEVDIDGKIFHDLRRTAARNIVRAGIQEQVAMRISAHRTRAVFDRYNIVSPDDLKNAARKMADFHATVTNRVTIGRIEEAGQKSPTLQVVEINR